MKFGIATGHKHVSDLNVYFVKLYDDEYTPKKDRLLSYYCHFSDWGENFEIFYYLEPEWNKLSNKKYFLSWALKSD